MAGATIFYTYDDATRQVASVALTQADANAAAVGGATTAAAGGQDTARDAAGNDVDAMLVEPRRDWYHHADAPHLRQSAPVLFPVRAGLRAWHNRLNELSRLLMQVGVHYPQADVNLGHDILFELHRGAWMIGTGSLAVRTKLQWLQASALGPADMAGGEQVYDADDPETFFEIAAGLATKEVPGPLSLVTLPGGARRTVAQMLAAAVPANSAAWGTAGIDVPTVAQLNRGRWIEEIAA